MISLEKLISSRSVCSQKSKIKTVVEQDSSEEIICNKFKKCVDCCNMLVIYREEHIAYILNIIDTSPSYYSSLDSSRTWMCFWALHSLELLGYKPEDTLCDKLIAFLSKCQHGNGGFGGSPGDYPHLASTYAAVSALVILGQYREEAYAVINRKTLQEFIQRCRLHDGSYKMAVDQEVDLRAIYCAVSVCRLTNIYYDEIFKDSEIYISKCQNYDGGLGSEEGMESNGGYTFCGYAALVLMDKEEAINQDRLLNWVSHRQLSMEGGFQGRTCKLVDSCYSYWVGSLFQIIQGNFLIDKDVFLNRLYSREALQYYIMICCQANSGGLSDRPLHHPDLYHTCYSLSGLALSQSSLIEDISDDHGRDHDEEDIVVGVEENKLVQNHPIYNVTLPALKTAMKYFMNQPNI